MKWESSDLAVGAVVVVASIILLGSFLWLSPVVAGRTYPLFAEFDRIDGIGDQANVVLRGYTVGRVGAIEPRMTDGDLRFRVRMDIEARLASGDSLLLPEGTIARLVPPPVIGAGLILLDTPERRAGVLAPGTTIPGERSTAIVEQVQGLTEDVSAEAVATMTTARSLMDSVTAAVTTANRALAATSTAIPTLVRGLERQLEATAGLTGDLRATIDTVRPATTATIDSITSLLSDSRRLIRDLHGTVRVTTPEIRQILARLDTTSILLNHFMLQVTERPYRILTGVSVPRGLEPPPPGAGIEPGSPADTVPELREDTTSSGTPRPETGGPMRP